jgi:hypothetical protein
VKYDDVKIWHKDDAGSQLTAEGAAWGLVNNFFILRKVARQAKAKLLELATSTGSYKYDSDDYFDVPGTPGGRDQEKYAKFPGLTPEDLDIIDSVIFEKANPDNKVTVAEVVAIQHTLPLHWTPPGDGLKKY